MVGIQTRDLIKKGLRHFLNSNAAITAIQTRDLIKKGLRLRFSWFAPVVCIQTRDLIKKGLRQEYFTLERVQILFKPETLLRRD